jgi:hypothetical protein
MRWAWLTFCTAAFLAAFFMRPASAEMYCFPSLEVAKGELAKHGETFRFSVVMKVGALAHVYAGKQTMTILVEQPDGRVCTGPALIGDIVKNAEDTCA